MESPVNNGIVIYCGIPDPVGFIWIPNSRCNCSSVKISPVLDTAPPPPPPATAAFLAKAAAATALIVSASSVAALVTLALAARAALRFV